MAESRKVALWVYIKMTKTSNLQNFSTSSLTCFCSINMTSMQMRTMKSLSLPN